MRIVLPCINHDFSQKTVEGGTAWLANLRDGFIQNGHEAKLVRLDSACDGDVMVIQSEWVEKYCYTSFQGKKIVLLGHFLGYPYPDPKKIQADKLVTTWKGEITDGFDTEYTPHGYNDSFEPKEGYGVIWAGNTYALRDEHWLSGVDLTSVSGVLPKDLPYKGAVCPNIYGTFQLGKVSTDATRISDKPGTMINERFWQVIGSGGILIDMYNPQVFDFFSPDEIISAKTKEEFQEKIAYYKDHIEEGVAFYTRAREKIRKHHTYKQRTAQMLCGLS